MALTPTADHDRARQDLDDHGYCLLANALSKQQIAQLKQRLIEQAQAEKSAGHAFEDGGPSQQWGTFLDEQGRVRPEAFKESNGGVNQRVWMLPNKGQVFLDLLDNQRPLDLVHHVLGDEILISSFTANIAKPGGVEMPLHTDQWWLPQPTRRDARDLPAGSITRSRFGDPGGENATHIAPAVVSNIIFMLDDFTAENGATHVVPGSHRKGRHPDAEVDADVESVQACAPAGTALITDGRVWHGTGANMSTHPRHAVLITFCGPQFRPQENFVAGTRKEVVASASPKVLALLGFKVWWGYGRTEHPTDEFINPATEPVGILKPTS